MTRVPESPRLQLRQAGTDARRPSVGIADSKILPTASTIVVLALCLGLVSPAALSQSCAPTEVVSELFRHSQLAERPEDREDRDDESCSAGGTTLVDAVADLQPLAVPRLDANRLRSQLRDAIAGRVLVALPRNSNNTNTLYVGCEDEILNIFDVAVEMRFFRRNIGADVIQLDVVYRHGDDDNDWHPFIDPDSGEIIVIPGTATNIMRELRQWLANFTGEDCPFPAARFAVYSMCEHANPEARDASDSSLRMEDGMPVVVGHSLGGAAAQFIATSRASRQGDGWPTCPGVNAYAFGSIGLTPSSVGAIRGTLKTYASDCDWLVCGLDCDPSFPFSDPFFDRVQTGHLFTLSSDSHSIDSIQRDLCGCLRGDENHVFHVHDSSQPPQANSDLCGLQNRQG